MIMRLVCGGALALGLVIAGCSAKSDETAAVESVPATTERSGVTDDSVMDDSATTAEPGSDDAEGAQPVKSEPDDPNAVYGVSDIPEVGGYIKLDLVDLPPATLNRVLHRLRTEPATCDGCEGYTLHDILSSSPDCMPCLIRSREIIAEERARH